jgi:hypothetical protein
MPDDGFVDFRPEHPAEVHQDDKESQAQHSGPDPGGQTMREGALSPLEKVQFRSTPYGVGRPFGSGECQSPVKEEPQEGQQNDQTGQERLESLTGWPVGRGLDFVSFLQSE